MSRRIPLLLIAIAMLLSTTPLRISPRAEGPSCSADQRLDSKGRHRELVVRARNINTRMARQRGLLSDHYPTAQDLGITDDNGFETTLISNADSYLFFIRDTADECHSAVYSDQRGTIYDAQPIR